MGLDVYPTVGSTLVVPAEYPTLQAAIDSAVAGDVIRVLPGNYAGPGNRGINLDDKSLTILGDGGQGEIVIECDRSYFLSFRAANRDTRLRLQNITVTDGSGDALSGGPVTTHGGTLDLVGCTLIGNFGGFGGAVRVIASGLQVSDCTFKDNYAEMGGAIAADSSTVFVERSVFVGNKAGGLGGAIYSNESQLNWNSCSVAFNSAATLASVLAAYGTRPARMDRCIIVANVGRTVFDCYYLPEMVVSCSDVYGNSAPDWTDCLEGQVGLRGNFSTDPLFCDLGSVDLRLRPESPCLPGNHPTGYDCGLIGAVGEVCGGPISTDPVSWGRIKSLFSEP